MKKLSLLYILLILLSCVKMPDELELEQIDFSTGNNNKLKTFVIEDPASIDVPEGDSALFKVSSMGTNLSFKWQKDLIDIDSSNDSTLILRNISRFNDSINIRCIVSGDSGIDTSKEACLRVLWPVKILSKPEQNVVSAGNSATFRVYTTGSGDITYNWYKNNSLIDSLNSSVISIENVSLSDSGSTFYCIAQNSEGADTSENATLSVVSALIQPKIKLQPSHQQVLLNSKAKFKVEAEGSDLKIDWYRTGNNETIGSGPSFVVYPASENDNGAQYYCSISNSLDTITSSTALLSVHSTHVKPKIISSLDTIELTLGVDTLISVEASGTELKYLWTLNDSTFKDTTDSRFIYLENLLMSDSGSLLKCYSINDSGIDSTKSIPIIINDTINKPVIISDLDNKTYSLGEDAVFTIQATGKNLSFEWYINDTLYSLAKDSVLSIPELTLDHNGKMIQCIVSNIKGSTPSAKVKLTVIDSILPIEITDHPTSTIVAEDSSTSFSVTANGSSIKYLWFKNNTALSGDTLRTLTISNASMSDSGALFKCFVYNDSSSDTSSTAILSVVSPPTIDTHPQPQVIGIGGTFSVSVSASGSKPFEYLWLKDNDTLRGETTSSLSITGVADSLDGTSYKCIVSNFAGVAISQSALLTVSLKPTLTDPNSVYVKNGNKATFTVTATGGSGNLLYQWQRDTINLETEVDPTLTIESCSFSNDSGSIYRCIVEDSLGEKDTSKYAVLHVLNPLSIDSQPTPKTISTNDDTYFRVIVSGSGPITYQWLRNDDSITDANESIFTISSANDSLSGSIYKCLITSPVDTLSTTPVQLTVGNKPNVTVNPDSITVESGNSATFQIRVAGGTGPITYKWYKDTTLQSSKINDTIFTIDTCTIAKDSGKLIRCIVEDSLGFKDSSKFALLRVFDSVNITTHPTSITNKEDGDTAIFTVIASGSRPFSYQWYRNGTKINSANDSFYVEYPLSYNTHNGYTYRCIVSNEIDSTTSVSASLTMLPPYDPERIEPSQNPPRGYAVEEVPQFVCIGIDDNTFSGDTGYETPKVIGENHVGIRWIHEFVKRHSNPNTANNPATYDGTPVTLSFFSLTTGMNGVNSDMPNLLKWIHNNLYTYGHEIGNHTHNHLNSNSDFRDTASVASWEKVINDFNSNISEPLPEITKPVWQESNTEGAGIPLTDVFGFRAPYLRVSTNMFTAISNINFKYDCSVEEGGYDDQDASNFYWPYTLHNGLTHHYTPETAAINNSYDGLMEIPAYLLEIVPDSLCSAYGIPSGLLAKIKAKVSWIDNKLIGYDYNLWAKFEASLSKAEVLAILKYNFDKRYNGNRAPFTFGMHSEYYRSQWDNYVDNATWQERQETIEEFITYVLQHQAARIVTHKQLYDWMRSPKKLQYR